MLFSWAPAELLLLFLPPKPRADSLSKQALSLPTGGETAFRTDAVGLGFYFIFLSAVECLQKKFLGRWISRKWKTWYENITQACVSSYDVFASVEEEKKKWHTHPCYGTMQPKHSILELFYHYSDRKKQSAVLPHLVGSSSNVGHFWSHCKKSSNEQFFLCVKIWTMQQKKSFHLADIVYRERNQSWSGGFRFRSKSQEGLMGGQQWGGEGGGGGPHLPFSMAAMNIEAFD